MKVINAEWMWYPGDYEIYLGGRMVFRRYRRNIIFPPSWRIDSPYKCVNFYKEIELEKDEEIFLKATGEVQIIIIGRAYPLSPSGENRYILPSGKYAIIVSVYSPDGLPAVFIDGAIKSGADWVVSENMTYGYSKTAYAVSPGTQKLTNPDILPGEGMFELKEIFPVSLDEEDGKKVYDFGKEYFGYVKLSGIKGDGKFTVCYGESREEALDENFCEVYDVEETSGRTEIMLKGSRAMRYISVISDDASFKDISFLYEYLPVESQCSFVCPDERINSIYDVALYTLHLTAREVFIDGIKRDRWPWCGDAYQSMLMNFYSFCDKELNERTLTFLIGKEPYNMHINHIIDYTFYWFIALYEHYMHFESKDFVKNIYPKAKKLMQFVLETKNEDGFVEHNDKTWVFVDWGNFTHDGVLAVEQILFHKALSVMAEFAVLFDDTEGYKLYSKEAKALKSKIFKIFWNDERGIFMHCMKDGIVTDEVTRYANIFALLYGYVKGEKKKRVIKALKESDMPAIITPYAKMFELAALGIAGENRYILNEIRTYWGEMLDRGATTFWELYDPEAEDQFSMYGRKFGKSYCHAWGASPLYLLGRYFIGVRPVKPGYEEYEVRPDAADLPSVKGKTAIPGGSVSVEIDKGKLKIFADSDKKGTLIWKGRKYDIPNRREMII